MATKLARLIWDLPLLERQRLDGFRVGDLFLVTPTHYHRDLVDAKSIATGEAFVLYRKYFEVVDDGAQLQG